MESGTIAIIVTAVLAAIAAFAGGWWLIGKKKLNAIKESIDVIATAINAIMDGNLSADEVDDIKAQLDEAIAAWKA